MVFNELFKDHHVIQIVHSESLSELFAQITGAGVINNEESYWNHFLLIFFKR